MVVIPRACTLLTTHVRILIADTYVKDTNEEDVPTHVAQRPENHAVSAVFRPQALRGRTSVTYR